MENLSDFYIRIAKEELNETETRKEQASSFTNGSANIRSSKNVKLVRYK